MPTGGGSPKTRHHRESPAFQQLIRALARRVRLIRLERGWTIEQAAERFSVEPAHIRRIEGSEANPSLAVLVSIAAALGLSVSELVREDERVGSRPPRSQPNNARFTK